MRADSLIPRLCEHLGLSIVRPLAGGEFGATLVKDEAETELVLKALPSETLGATFERGAAIAMHMRSRGYPAPRYYGTGVALGATWSLQALMPGTCPDRVTETHMRRLLELAGTHAGAVPGPGYAPDEEFRQTELSLSSALSFESSRHLAEELASVIHRLEGLRLLQDGVVHGDYHHRNFLAIGDEVTGIIDWELACAGDWRQDVVTLAFWSAMVPNQVPPAVARIAIDHARAVCPPSVLAYFAASRALTQIGFEARVRPDALPQTVLAIESTIRPWWQAADG